jgi:hypothetical protein
MSGDIGIGATRAAVKLSQKVLAARLPGYVQLAGGTNDHTVMKLRDVGLLNEQGRRNDPDQPVNHIQNPKSHVAGIAYGSYARVLLSPILEKLEQPNGEAADANLISLQNPSLGCLEESPRLLWQAVETAHSLVSQLKISQRHDPNPDKTKPEH